MSRLSGFYVRSIRWVLRAVGAAPSADEEALARARLAAGLPPDVSDEEARTVAALRSLSDEELARVLDDARERLDDSGEEGSA